MYELAVIGGTVYLEGKLTACNIYCNKGKIEKITDPETILLADTRVNAESIWVLPGLIDPHVHLNLGVGDTLTRDNFEVGSKLAAFGGVTTIVDFLAPIKYENEAVDALEKRRVDAEKSVIDYGFHVTIADYFDDCENLANWCIAEGMPSVKLFTTYKSTDRMASNDTIERLLYQSALKPVNVHVHAEEDTLIDESKGAPVSRHGMRRPVESERAAIKKLAEMTERTKGYCYIVHTNCGSSIEWLQKEHAEILLSKHFMLESCPQYLLWHDAVYHGENNYKYIMTPPIRPEIEQIKLKASFEQIDVIGTDHCPYLFKHKKQLTLDQLPNGIEGLPYTLPSLFGIFGKSVLPKLTHQSAKIHGLYPQKGVIAVGSDADFCLFDPNKTWRVSGSEPWIELTADEAEASPYFGQAMKGSVVSTISRSKIIMEKGKIHTSKGRFIKRRLSR